MHMSYFSTPEGMAVAGAIIVVALFIMKSMFKSDNSMIGMLIFFGIAIGAAILFIMSLDPIQSPGMSASGPQLKMPRW